MSVLVCLLATASVGSASVFLTAKKYPSGELPVAAAVQDFNNDGSADIATANQNDKNVSLFLNQGDGTFAPANTFPVGAGASDIVSRDLNDDGDFDLIVTDGISSLNIAFGHGDGTFDPATTIKVGEYSGQLPHEIGIADLNSDGILDLAIAMYAEEIDTAGKVAVLIGQGEGSQGEGSFAPPVFYPVMEDPTGLVATDLNNDGVLDLAVAIQLFSDQNKGLAVLLGNGDGTFQPAVTSVDRGFASDIAAGDFNGDGNMDLALAQNYKDEVWVVLGKGDGTFQPVTVYSTGDVGAKVRAADVSGDGVLDLVSSATAILLGDGAGGFGAPALYAIGGSYFAEIGYFNSDQVPDIVAPGFSEIDVAFGRAHGAFRAPIEYPVEGGTWDSADFDGDGNADVVSGGGKLSFVPGLGDGTFAGAILFSNLEAKDLIAADLNRDRKPDILFTQDNNNKIYTMLGNGDGTFQSAQTAEVRGIELSFPVVADFNHDLHPDVALTRVLDDRLEILLGNGDGSFQPTISIPTGDVPQSPTVADFNLDGNSDVAVSNTVGGTVGVYLGHGDGTFDSPITTTSQNPIYSATADVNKDGKPDMVLGGDGLKVFLGNGDGTFQSPQTVYSSYGPVKIADVDRDGRRDIVVSADFDALAVLRGEGDGTFRPAVEFPPAVGNFVLKDLNHDKLPEAIVGSLTVLINTSHAE